MRIAITLLLAAAAFAGQPEALMQAGRYREAAALYEAAVKKNPRAAEAFLALGVCYSQIGRRADAIGALKRHIALAPRSGEGHTVLGLLLLEAGELQQAETALAAARRLSPGEPEASKGLARVYWLQNQPARGAELLKPLAARDAEAKLLLAEVLLQAARPREAAALTRELSRPGAPESAAVLACRAELAAGDEAEAVRACEAGLRGYPESDRLAALYLTLPPDVLDRRLRERAAAGGNDVRETLALARTLMDVDPERKTSALQTAARLLERVRGLAPKDPLAQYLRARLLRLQGRPEAEVFAEYDKAIAWGASDPLKIRIWIDTGERAALLSQADAAERALASAVEVNRRIESPRAEAPFAYYRFLRDRARTGEAAQMLEETLRYEPMHPAARLERAKAAASGEHWREAAREAELALSGAGGDPSTVRAAHALLARVYNALEDSAQAQKHQRWIEEH